MESEVYGFEFHSFAAGLGVTLNLQNGCIKKKPGAPGGNTNVETEENMQTPYKTRLRPPHLGLKPWTLLENDRAIQYTTVPPYIVHTYPSINKSPDVCYLFDSDPFVAPCSGQAEFQESRAINALRQVVNTQSGLRHEHVNVLQLRPL